MVWLRVELDGAGMVGMLQRNEVDIQLGAMTVLAAREQVSPRGFICCTRNNLLQVIDFTIPYYEEPTSFVTHKPAPLAKWLAIFSPFMPEVSKKFAKHHKDRKY